MCFDINSYPIFFCTEVKHEDYNMMVSEMPHKCKLIPRSDLSHLETVCFDMSEKMLGPCGHADISKFNICSLTDVLDEDDFLQPLSEEGRNFIKLLVETYFSEDVSSVLDDPTASLSNNPIFQKKYDLGIKGPPDSLEGKELFVGSSSWPWKQNPKKDSNKSVNRKNHYGVFRKICFNQKLYKIAALF